MKRPQGVGAQLCHWSWPFLVAVAVVLTSTGIPAPTPVAILARPPSPYTAPAPPLPTRSSLRDTIDFVELTAVQIHDDLLAERYTVTELTQAFLDRIARYEDHYNAFISMNPEALAIAAALDEELRTSGPRGPLHGVPPAAPTATEEGDAYQAWRMEMRALFRAVLADHELDGLFFPQAGEPIRPLVEDAERPEYRPNNHAELPSNIINDIGLPTVTVPFSYYADGTPFVLAFIGDLWSDADLLAWAYDLERATLARVAPELTVGPG